MRTTMYFLFKKKLVILPSNKFPVYLSTYASANILLSVKDKEIYSILSPRNPTVLCLQSRMTITPSSLKWRSRPYWNLLLQTPADHEDSLDQEFSFLVRTAYSWIR